jgi:hypothetical protein
VTLLKQKVLTAILRRLDALLFGKLLAGAHPILCLFIWLCFRHKEFRNFDALDCRSFQWRSLSAIEVPRMAAHKPQQA